MRSYRLLNYNVYLRLSGIAWYYLQIEILMLEMKLLEQHRIPNAIDRSCATACHNLLLSRSLYERDYVRQVTSERAPKSELTFRSADGSTNLYTIIESIAASLHFQRSISFQTPGRVQSRYSMAQGQCKRNSHAECDSQGWFATNAMLDHSLSSTMSFALASCAMAYSFDRLSNGRSRA